MSQITTTLEYKEKSAQFLWTLFILGFFLIQAIIWSIAITWTLNDRSHAVVAGYDEKALLWDEQRAQQRASAKLGWRAGLHVDPVSDVRNQHIISLTITDAQDAPIAGASIELAAFHCARAGEPQQIELVETGEGIYAGTIRVGKTGLWQFEGQVNHRDGVLRIQEKQFLKAGG